MITVKSKNEGTQVSDVNTGKPADSSITLKRKKMNESADINKLINSDDRSKLTKYLASLGDGAEVDDPYDKNTIYHKASNGVKSGWACLTKGKRTNVVLFKNEEVARLISKDEHRSMVRKSAVNESVMNESVSLDDIKSAKSGDYISVGKSSYSKVKKGLWQQDTTSAHGIGATYSDSQMYNLIKDKDAKLINESADMAQVSTLEGQGCDGEAVAVPCAMEEPVAEIMPKKDDSQKFTDKKYMTILNMLKANGYDAKFFGSEGYLIPDKYPDTKVRLVCRTISEGFKINVIGGLYDMATSKDCVKQLRECNLLADKLNQILVSDTTDINEMVDAQILTPDEENLAD